MEPVAHILIPLLFLLAFFPKLEKKYVFGLLFLAILPDVDYLINPALHRFLFHNIFFVLIVAYGIYALWDKKAFFVALYYTMVHLLLDFYSKGAVALFWPISKKFYQFVFNIKYFGGWDFKVQFGLDLLEASQVKFYYGASILTTTGVLLLILLLVTGGIAFYNKKYNNSIDVTKRL